MECLKKAGGGGPLETGRSRAPARPVYEQVAVALYRLGDTGTMEKERIQFSMILQCRAPTGIRSPPQIVEIANPQM